MYISKFPHYHQQESADCGPACLRMIAKYYGRQYSLEMLREHSFISREGVSMLGISDAAEYLGMHTLGVKISFEQLANRFVKACKRKMRFNFFENSDSVIQNESVRLEIIMRNDHLHGFCP